MGGGLGDGGWSRLIVKWVCRGRLWWGVLRLEGRGYYDFCGG